MALQDSDKHRDCGAVGAYAESGASAVTAVLRNLKEGSIQTAVLACVESAEKRPEFAADHCRGALASLGVRLKPTER